MEFFNKFDVDPKKLQLPTKVKTLSINANLPKLDMEVNIFYLEYFKHRT
jgi:hypothetical protein